MEINDCTEICSMQENNQPEVMGLDLFGRKVFEVFAYYMQRILVQIVHLKNNQILSKFNEKSSHVG